MSFTDISGLYSASNTGGYDNASTIDFDDVTDAYITITDSAGDATVYNVFSQLGALSPPWTEDIVFSDLSIDIPDGLSTVVYTVKVGATTYTSQTYKFYVYCDIRCCIFDNIHTAVKLYGNDPCKHAAKIGYAMYLCALYQDFLNAAQGCNFNEAATMFTKLSAVCTSNNTNCGC